MKIAGSAIAPDANVAESRIAESIRVRILISGFGSLVVEGVRSGEEGGGNIASFRHSIVQGTIFPNIPNINFQAKNINVVDRDGVFFIAVDTTEFLPTYFCFNQFWDLTVLHILI